MKISQKATMTLINLQANHCIVFASFLLSFYPHAVSLKEAELHENGIKNELRKLNIHANQIQRVRI